MPESIAFFPSPVDTRPSMAHRLHRWLNAVLATADERRKLAALDDRQLADIGVSRATVDAEAARPFWDLPAWAWRA